MTLGGVAEMGWPCSGCSMKLSWWALPSGMWTGVTQVWFAQQGKAVVLSWDRHTRGGMARKGDRDQLAGFGHHKHEIILGSKERCGAGSRCLVRGRSQLEIKVWGSVWGWTGSSETCSDSQAVSVDYARPTTAAQGHTDVPRPP